MDKKSLLNLMLSEGATHFKEFPDGDIRFEKPSKFFENYTTYRWAYKNLTGYDLGPSWSLTGQIFETVEIKNFIV